jgi:hypothetical protein
MADYFIKIYNGKQLSEFNILTDSSNNKIYNETLGGYDFTFSPNWNTGATDYSATLTINYNKVSINNTDGIELRGIELEGENYTASDFYNSLFHYVTKLETNDPDIEKEIELTEEYMYISYVKPNKHYSGRDIVFSFANTTSETNTDIYTYSIDNLIGTVICDKDAGFSNTEKITLYVGSLITKIYNLQLIGTTYIDNFEWTKDNFYKSSYLKAVYVSHDFNIGYLFATANSTDDIVLSTVCKMNIDAAYMLDNVRLLTGYFTWLNALVGVRRLFIDRHIQNSDQYVSEETEQTSALIEEAYLEFDSNIVNYLDTSTFLISVYANASYMKELYIDCDKLLLLDSSQQVYLDVINLDCNSVQAFSSSDASSPYTTPFNVAHYAYNDIYEAVWKLNNIRWFKVDNEYYMFTQYVSDNIKDLFDWKASHRVFTQPQYLATLVNGDWVTITLSDSTLQQLQLTLNDETKTIGLQLIQGEPSSTESPICVAIDNQWYQVKY